MNTPIEIALSPEAKYIWEQTDLGVTNLTANSLLFTANIRKNSLCSMNERMNEPGRKQRGLAI